MEPAKAVTMSPGIASISALGMRIDATSYQDAVSRIVEWAHKGESRTVAAACVHMVMEAYDERAYREIVNSCDMVTPDGMPLVWLQRARGIRTASRVYGPNLTLHLLEAAHRQKIPIGFYGGSPQALDGLLDVVQRVYANAPIVYACAPPFRPLDQLEQAQVVEDIRASGARIVFVGLGCPKQERWIAAHRGQIQATMIAVGAAFDFISGIKPQAPRWMQKSGLEWVFRMLTEPRRLTGRYLKTNPRFVVLAAIQLWTERHNRHRSASI